VCFVASGQGCYIFNENMEAALMKRVLSDNLLLAEMCFRLPGSDCTRTTRSFSHTRCSMRRV
jgi:hypothetical protein